MAAAGECKSEANGVIDSRHKKYAADSNGQERNSNLSKRSSPKEKSKQKKEKGNEEKDEEMGIVHEDGQHQDEHI